MFTRDSRKLYLALLAMLSLGVLYACIVTALSALSTRAEQELHAFPFKDEDWLRYLLPSRFGPESRPRMMLTGPSTVRENLLVDRFEAQFPGYAIFQGGLSLGTLEDVTVSLDYVRSAYGVDALPEVLILGISPRFVANIPDERPFKRAIDQYSPHVATRQEPHRTRLVPKDWWESVRARVRFLGSKAPERFRTALLALAYYWMAGGTQHDTGPHIESSGNNRPQSLADRLLRLPPVVQVLRTSELPRVNDHTFLELLEWRISPYKYSLSAPYQYSAGTNMHTGWWKDVYAWSPLQDWRRTEARLQEFQDLAIACGIEVWVVNLPEREVSRAQFDETNYQAYLSLVRRVFGEQRFLDLRELLRTDEFHDREHTRPAGSRRLTDAVIARVGAAVPASGNPRAARPASCEPDATRR